jgi:asparagine synthase (glutamine-hydrolysing)
MNLNRTVYLHSRERQASIVLDGIDGDVLLSGTGAVSSLWRSGAMKDALGETLGVGGLTRTYTPGVKLLYKSLRTTFMPESLRRLRRWLREDVFSRQNKKREMQQICSETIINPEFAQGAAVLERMERLQSHRTLPASASQVEMHIQSVLHPFLTVGLERYHRVASQFGIEPGHPLADIRLVSFCLGLPWYLKSHRGWTKMVLRKASEPLLPASITWRKDKDSLMWYYSYLLLKENSDRIIQAIKDEKEALIFFVDFAKCSRYCDDFRTNPSEDHAEDIWNAAALAFWLRQQRNLPHSV